MDQQTEHAERRASKRAKSIKTGQIVYRNGYCVMDCLILDIAEAGAKLRPSDPVSCPPSFTLRIDTGVGYQCDVVRRSGRDIGVRFRNPQSGQ